jgi:hypothetical protein
MEERQETERRSFTKADSGASHATLKIQCSVRETVLQRECGAAWE